MPRTTHISGPGRLAIVTVIAVVFGVLYYKSRFGLPPYGWGAVALVSVWIIIWLLMETLNPFKLVIGADGRPSTSKLKPFLWTAVVVFSYAALYAARTKKGYIEAIAEVPVSLLMAIGFDAATLVAAKSITESQIANRQIEKPPPADPSAKKESATVDTQANDGPGAVFQDDKGFPDLAKIQTVTWTVFAIVIYLITVNSVLIELGGDKVPYFSPTGQALGPRYGLPEIAPALMVLIGLGNAAYLGKKLVTTDTPVLTAMALARNGTKSEITLTGVALGATQNGSRIIVNDKEIDVVPLQWSNQGVKFNLPDKNPENGSDWVSGQTVRIGLFVRGQTTNQLTFTIEPFIEVSPITGGVGTPVTVKGTALGATGELNLNNSKLESSAITSWTNEEIKFTIPTEHPKGTTLAKGTFPLSVTVQKKESNKVGFTVT